MTHHATTGRARRARPRARRPTLLAVALLALALVVSIRPASLLGRQPPPAEPVDAVLARDGADATTPIEIDWRVLATLDHRGGRTSDVLRRLDGRRVRIPGFIVPLDDLADDVTEFLLVPYFGACVHTPPPPPNQMVHVTMDRGRRARTSWWTPVWIEGTLRVATYRSIYGAAGFRLTGERVTPYEEDER